MVTDPYVLTAYMHKYSELRMFMNFVSAVSKFQIYDPLSTRHSANDHTNRTSKSTFELRASCELQEKPNDNITLRAVITTKKTDASVTDAFVRDLRQREVRDPNRQHDCMQPGAIDT